ncbi:MAG: hypothetical protein L3J50_03190 [Emcibacter sp.]|nr:hypothetical protein [Emcibacter sp.]
MLTYKDTSKEIEVSGSEYVINCMRDLSQVVFAKFQEFFIDKKLNLFSEIDALTLDQLSGGRTGFIQSSLSNNKINAEIEITKTKLKAFISFQLGNTKIDSGIGYGYYDLKGNEDKKGINAAYNAYLFNVVFNPEKSENAYPYFLDYLLINSGSTFEYHSKRRLLKCEKYKDVLDIGRLKGYIEKHQKNLIAEIDRLVDQKRQITFDKEVMTYQDYKQDITTFLETKGVE